MNISYEYVFIYLFSTKVCDGCLKSFENELNDSVCKCVCKIFKGDGTVDQFCDWIFSKENKNSVAIAHNAKGYSTI